MACQELEHAITLCNWVIDSQVLVWNRRFEYDFSDRIVSRAVVPESTLKRGTEKRYFIPLPKESLRISSTTSIPLFDPFQQVKTMSTARSQTTPSDNSEKILATRRRLLFGIFDECDTNTATPSGTEIANGIQCCLTKWISQDAKIMPDWLEDDRGVTCVTYFSQPSDLLINLPIVQHCY